MDRTLRLAAVALVAALAAGCAAQTIPLPGGYAILTGADRRAIVEVPVASDAPPGRVRPTHVHCAEPSPDIAVAVSKGFNLGTAVSVSGLPGGIDPRVAFAISHASAQAIAQLTERLATIQLLRDGLQRACEAYANGAISDTTYAVMLSRFDKLMVTMLLGELTAGAFGRSLAALGGEVDGAASALLGDQATATGTGGASPGSGSAQTGAKAAATAAGQIAVARGAGGVGNALAEMQRKYIENLNFDAVEVACVSALDRGAAAPGLATAAAEYAAAEAAKDGVALARASEKLARASEQAGLTPLAGYCLSGLLPKIQESKGALVLELIRRATAERQRAEERAGSARPATPAQEK